MSNSTRRPRPTLSDSSSLCLMKRWPVLLTCVFNPIQVTLQNHFSLPLFFQYGTMEAVVPLKWIKKHRASLIEDSVQAALPRDYRCKKQPLSYSSSLHGSPNRTHKDSWGHRSASEFPTICMFHCIVCYIADKIGLHRRHVRYALQCIFLAHVCSRDLELDMTQFSNNRLHWLFL